MTKHYASALLAAALLGGCLLDNDARDSEPDQLPAMVRFVQSRESKVATAMQGLLLDGPMLEAFLRAFPKGADLHNHTSGALTTEKLIAWGGADGACVDPTTFVASHPCAPGTLPLSAATPGTSLYASVLAAWSMEGFTGPLLQAHQHFFDAFGKYGAIQTNDRADDSYADVMSTAGQNHQLYLELLQGFGSGAGGAIAADLFAESDVWDQPTLLARRAQIIAQPAFALALTMQAASIATSLSAARTLLACGTDAPDPGCGVDVRLIVAANRTGTRVAVFGQWVFAYELAQLVPEVVGVNLVSPEENANSLQFYDDEMFALGVLDDWNDHTSGRKPVHVSLHAGELIPEILPSDQQQHLTYHIRRAVEVAHAERIGHGVDVLGETEGDGVTDLLRDMSRAGVMVEICLTSNRVLLGVAGNDHPLGHYLRQSVPVALATDDEGILRGDITDEYVAAVVDQKLGYRTLKQLARTSLEHAFVEGESLWAALDELGEPVAECQSDALGKDAPSALCSAYLDANRRAALQWKLESQLAAFENEILHL